MLVKVEGKKQALAEKVNIGSTSPINKRRVALI